jgi:2-succinyl-6-hydroxy-2,4-cyclohexadiene-1-carboxylate synthase
MHLRVNGATLGAELREPSRPNGLTLALLHGFTGSAAGWGAHLDAFAAAGLRVVALDLLGHGASDAPGDPARYAFARTRGDLLAALEQLGALPETTLLLGYSLGGRIALYTALGACFRGLVLESASPGLAAEGERAARRASDAALAARIEREGIPAFVAEWERLPLFASQASLPAEARAARRAERLRNSAVGLANSLRGMGTGAQPPLHDSLPALQTPCLLIAGALDAKFAGIAREMAARLLQAELRIVPDAGHAVHLERPDAFDAAVIAFCERLR